jgi:hypothetical protein
MPLPFKIDDRILYFLVFSMFCILTIIIRESDPKNLDHFLEIKLNSKIIELGRLRKGLFLIKLKHQNETVEFNLPVSGVAELDSIHIGDSLSKNANSRDVEVFRLDEFGYPYKVSDFYIH